jgi:hypothetical protein
MLTPESFVSLTFTATSTDWYITDYSYSTNNVSVDYVQANNLYLYGPTTINSYVTPTTTSQIGYTYTTAYGDTLTNSSGFTDYRPISMPGAFTISDGTWLFNVRVKITSSSATTYRAGTTFGTSNTSLLNLNVMANWHNTNARNIEAASSTTGMVEHAYSFVYNSTASNNLYVWYFLKYGATVASGTINVYWQCTRIA